MSIPEIPPEFDELSTAEKIEYVQRLWDRIADEAKSTALTDEQRAELDRRLEEHRANPEALRSWSEVRKRIRDNE